MPSSIFIARINRYIERLFNVKGGASLFDISPSISVEVPILIGNEDRYLQGWNRFAVFVNQPAVAGQFSAVQFRNPVGSNLMVVFEKFIDAEGAVDNPHLNLKLPPQGDFATNTPNIQRLDARQANQVSAMVITNGSAAAQSGNIIYFGQIPTTTSPIVEYIVTQNQEIIIGPGDALIHWGGVVNTSINVAAVWRERGLEPSELTP